MNIYQERVESQLTNVNNQRFEILSDRSSKNNSFQRATLLIKKGLN